MTDQSSFRVDPTHEELAIEIDASQPALQVTLFDFSSGVPGGAKLTLPRLHAVEALRALITELYVNEEVYADLLDKHLKESASL